jgi:hypothetical protein
VLDYFLRGQCAALLAKDERRKYHEQLRAKQARLDPAPAREGDGPPHDTATVPVAQLTREEHANLAQEALPAPLTAPSPAEDPATPLQAKQAAATDARPCAGEASHPLGPVAKRKHDELEDTPPMPEPPQYTPPAQITLLDVGSCFNPFGKEAFVVAITVCCLARCLQPHLRVFSNHPAHAFLS